MVNGRATVRMRRLPVPESGLQLAHGCDAKCEPDRETLFVSEPYEVNDTEFASVSALEGRQRFEHLLKRICDTETVFLLIDDDGLVVLTDEENAAPPQVPVWPHPRYAEAYRASFGGGAGHGPDGADGVRRRCVATPRAGGRQPCRRADRAAARCRHRGGRAPKAIISYHEEWYGGWPK